MDLSPGFLAIILFSVVIVHQSVRYFNHNKKRNKLFAELCNLTAKRDLAVKRYKEAVSATPINSDLLYATISDVVDAEWDLVKVNQDLEDMGYIVHNVKFTKLVPPTQ